jgi:FtsZ-interacting cell division protein ZipA
MTTAQIIILIAVIVVAAIAVWAFLQSRRSKSLRRRFGPEYERAVHDYGGRFRAERALEHRAHRIEKYRIRALNHEEQQRFAEEWRRTQARFVDDPALAIREADSLVAEAMNVRGYPMADFEHRAEDLSVDHPHVVRNYRTAHAIAVAQQQGRASTEDLRQGMVLYRELFDEILETQPAGMPQGRK